LLFDNALEVIYVLVGPTSNVAMPHDYKKQLFAASWENPWTVEPYSTVHGFFLINSGACLGDEMHGLH
jgi:hypothetical protein